MKLEWKEKKEKYSNGETGLSGVIPIYDINWDCAPNPQEAPWKLTTRMPVNHNGYLGNYKDRKEARKDAEKHFTWWLEKACLRRQRSPKK
jgi:hypothetical protein